MGRGREISQPGLPQQNLPDSWLKEQTFIHHSHGGQKLKIEEQAGIVSPEVSLLGLLRAAFSLRVHVFFFSVQEPLGSLLLLGRPPAL